MCARKGIVLVMAVILVILQIPAITAQQAIKSQNAAADWPMFSHDLGATRYSPLKQINTGNVGRLKLAWSMPYRADRNGAAAGVLGGLSEATPVVVNGIMYLPAENRVLALDAASGKEVWKFDVQPAQGNALSKRG